LLNDGFLFEGSARSHVLQK
jgi:Predicted 3'-5' exonuclease related to the exonuclease domain of PolB